MFRSLWTRITEPVGGRLSYKPPIYDINAPDLYIPLMAFGKYVVLAGFSLGLQGKFTPEALNWLFMKGIVGWFLQVSLLKMSLFSLGGAEAPLLDIVAYAGYAFTGLCLAVLGRIIVSYSYSLAKLGGSIFPNSGRGGGGSRPKEVAPLLLLLLNAVDLPMHGNLFGENYETRSFFGG
ncbi:putative Yif1 family protein [Helianthus annuus]|nr:putative Yif1 family protein [Helianthus annuus]